MKVLIGFSTCQYTRAAFEKRGHEVWTCDFRFADGERHLQRDVFDVIRDSSWDMAVFHPTCTFFTLSSAWAMKDPDYVRYPGVGYHQRVKSTTKVGKERRDAFEIELRQFKVLDSLPYPHAIENPAPSILNTKYRPPDQVIQPYQFGDDAQKGTGLWLKDLPPLVIDPSQRFHGRLIRRRGKLVERFSNQTNSGQNNLSASEDRWLIRSATYPGIAEAMGKNWG